MADLPSDTALLGIDFSCAPGPRKPITVAHGRLQRGRLVLDRVEDLGTLEAFEGLLARPGPWVGAFDFPFGLPRVFVDELGLGGDAAGVIAELRRRCPQRLALRRLVDDWAAATPQRARRRLPHRRTDAALPGLSSTSPLQTRYVPVGFMYYEGLWRLLQSGVALPGLREGDPSRVALEGYPGLAAHRLVGRRSYKNRDAPDRRQARRDMLDGLSRGAIDGAPPMSIDPRWREALLADAGGDRLDAVLCLLQAAHAWRLPRWGLPDAVDPVEGWIVGSTAGGAPAAG